MERNDLGQFTTESRGELSPRWSGGKENWGIALNCSHCGKEFRTHRSRYRQSKSKIFYCTVDCMKKATKVEVTCAVCGKKKTLYRSDLKVKNRGSFCSQTCARSVAVGDRNGAWKGGRVVDVHGYIWIRKPDHPFAGSNGYVREHRLVMEEYLGRYLLMDEVVHHINGNRQDNYIDNLELTTNSEHSTHHNHVRWGNKQPGKVKT